MLALSGLRVLAIVIGTLAITVSLRKFRSFAGTRTDAWLLFFFGLALLLVGVFPDLAAIPSTVLRLEGHLWGRLLTLLILSNLLLWLLLLYQRAKTEQRYDQFDRLVRALTVQEFLRHNSLDQARGAIVVLIPAYNEAENIGAVLEKIPEEVCGRAVQVLVINDGSLDQTAEVAGRHQALVATHPANRGGGAALKTGYALAAPQYPAVIVTIDGDGQHDPSQIATLVEPILAGEADLVIGSRVLGDSRDTSKLRLFGVHLFSRLINLIIGTKITDCSSGYRAMGGTLLQECQLLQEQYHTAEVIIEAAKRQFVITERPITISPRLSGASKKGPNLKYGLLFLRTIIKTWLR